MSSMLPDDDLLARARAHRGVTGDHRGSPGTELGKSWIQNIKEQMKAMRVMQVESSKASISGLAPSASMQLSTAPSADHAVSTAGAVQNPWQTSGGPLLESTLVGSQVYSGLPNTDVGGIRSVNNTTSGLSPIAPYATTGHAGGLSTMPGSVHNISHSPTLLGNPTVVNANAIETKDLLRQLTETRKELTERTIELASERKHTQGLVSQHKESTQHLSELLKMKDDMLRDKDVGLDKMRNELLEKMNKISALQRDSKQSSRQKLELLQDQLMQRDATITKLKLERQRLKQTSDTEMKALQRRVQDQQYQITYLTEARDKLSGDASALRAKTDAAGEARVQSASLRLEHDRLLAELSDVKIELEKSQLALVTTNAEHRAELERCRESYKRELSSTRKVYDRELHTLKASLASLSEQVQHQAEQDHALARDAASRWGQQKEMLQNELEQTQGELYRLKEDHTHTESHLQRASRDRITDLERQVADEQGNNEQLVKALHTQRDRYESEIRELVSAQSGSVDQDRYQSAVRQKTEAEKRVLQLEKEVAELSARIPVLENENALLKKTATDASTEKNQFLQTSDTMREYVAELERFQQQIIDDNTKKDEVISQLKLLARDSEELTHIKRKLVLCATDVRALKSVIEMRLEGRDPNMSLLLGSPDTSLDLSTAGQTDNSIDSLANELTTLRSLIADKYAEQIGDGCGIQ